MSEIEKEDIVRDYEEHFFMAAESGKTEKEIIALLGDPVFLAKSYSSEKIIKKLESNAPVQKKLLPLVQSYLLVAGLGFVNIIFFGIPYFIAFCLMFFFWVGTVGFLLVNLFRFIVNVALDTYGFILFHQVDAQDISLIFKLLGSTFLGVILIFIVYHSSNLLLKIFIKHVQLNLKIAGIEGDKKL